MVETLRDVAVGRVVDVVSTCSRSAACKGSHQWARHILVALLKWMCCRQVPIPCPRLRRLGSDSLLVNVDCRVMCFRTARWDKVQRATLIVGIAGAAVLVHRCNFGAIVDLSAVAACLMPDVRISVIQPSGLKPLAEPLLLIMYAGILNTVSDQGVAGTFMLF